MDPGHDIQNQIIVRLRAYAPLTSIVAQRVYDDPPRNATGHPTATLPYISMGPRQVLQDDADCVEGYEAFFQIDIWSAGPGNNQVSQIAQNVRQALRDYELPLSAANVLVDLEHQSTQYLPDPDGLTRRAIVTMRAMVEAVEEED